jgi:hypothetical protein
MAFVKWITKRAPLSVELEPSTMFIHQKIAGSYELTSRSHPTRNYDKYWAPIDAAYAEEHTPPRRASPLPETRNSKSRKIEAKIIYV